MGRRLAWHPSNIYLPGSFFCKEKSTMGRRLRYAPSKIYLPGLLNESQVLGNVYIDHCAPVCNCVFGLMSQRY